MENELRPGESLYGFVLACAFPQGSLVEDWIGSARSSEDVAAALRHLPPYSADWEASEYAAEASVELAPLVSAYSEVAVRLLVGLGRGRLDWLADLAEALAAAFARWAVEAN